MPSKVQSSAISFSPSPRLQPGAPYHSLSRLPLSLSDSFSRSPLAHSLSRSPTVALSLSSPLFPAIVSPPFSAVPPTLHSESPPMSHPDSVCRIGGVVMEMEADKKSLSYYGILEFLVLGRNLLLKK